MLLKNQNLFLHTYNNINFSILLFKDFRLDASSETLLLENDPDLKYLNEINNRYGAKEFLVLTYSPR